MLTSQITPVFSCTQSCTLYTVQECVFKLLQIKKTCNILHRVQSLCQFLVHSLITIKTHQSNKPEVDKDKGALYVFKRVYSLVFYKICPNLDSVKYNIQMYLHADAWDSNQNIWFRNSRFIPTELSRLKSCFEALLYVATSNVTPSSEQLLCDT